MLVIERSGKGYTDAARAYKVYIDGFKVGQIRKGETLRLDPGIGMHKLKLKIDWCSSKELSFMIEPGKTVYAECAPAKKPFLFGELLYITLMTDRYIDLKITNP